MKIREILSAVGLNTLLQQEQGLDIWLGNGGFQRPAANNVV